MGLVNRLLNYAGVDQDITISGFRKLLAKSTYLLQHKLILLLQKFASMFLAHINCVHLIMVDFFYLHV